MSLTKVSFSMIQDTMLNVLDYGADSTGIADSTSNINSAIAESISTNKPVYIPYGTYKFNGYTCAETDAFNLSIIGEEGNQPTLVCTQAAADAGLVMFGLPNTRYSNVTGLVLSTDIFPGQSYFEVTNASALEVGMVIQISTSRQWYNGARYNPVTGTGKFCGEIHRIVGIDTNKVYIEDFTRDNYSPTDASYTIVIRAWNPCQITIKNLIFETPYTTAGITSVGVQIQQSVNSVVENVKLKGFIQRCLSDKLTINSKYTNIVFEQTIDMPNINVNGYGLATDGSVGLLLEGLKSNGQRRAFDADCIDGIPSNGSAPFIYPGINGPARDWMVTNFVVNGGGAFLPSDLDASAFSYGLGMHGGSENGIFSNGFVSDCTNGINCRGRNTTIDNVSFSGPMSRVIALYEEAAGIVVRNCTYDSFTYPNKNTLKVYSISVAAGGSGYVSAPTVAITAPTSGTTATATAVLTGDAVTSVTVVLAGSGYTEPPAISFSGGSGSGAVAYPVMDFVNPVTDTTGCVFFISLGINNTTGICYYDIPNVIENNTVKGCYGSFAVFYALAANPYIENVTITNNQVEFINPNGGTSYMYNASGSLNINSGNFSDNTFKTITGFAEWFDSSLSIGVRKTNDPTVNFQFENEYRVTIADNSVVKIPQVSRTGDRLMVTYQIRNNEGFIVTMTPASASATTIGGSVAGTEFTANGPGLTGTTGTNTKQTLGLYNADLWIENRRGATISSKIQVL